MALYPIRMFHQDADKSTHQVLPSKERYVRSQVTPPRLGDAEALQGPSRWSLGCPIMHRSCNKLP